MVPYHGHVRNVLFCWSSGVTDEQASDAAAGIRRVLQIIDQDYGLEILGRGWDADRWIEHNSTDGIERGSPGNFEKAS
jgi:hypothetical protein